MEPYVIDRTSNSRRRAVEEWLFGLDLVTPELREKIVTAWVTTWGSSPSCWKARARSPTTRSPGDSGLAPALICPRRTG
jgi:hypothetical protein